MVTVFKKKSEFLVSSKLSVLEACKFLGLIPCFSSLYFFISYFYLSNFSILFTMRSKLKDMYPINKNKKELKQINFLTGLIFSTVEPSILSSFSTQDLGPVLACTIGIAMMCYSGYYLYYGTPATVANIGPDASSEIVAAVSGGIVAGTTAVPSVVVVKAASSVVGTCAGFVAGSNFCLDGGTNIAILPGNMTYAYFVGYASAYSELENAVATLEGLAALQYGDGFKQGTAALAAVLAGGACTEKTAEVFGVVHGVNTQCAEVLEKNGLPVTYDGYLDILKAKKAAAEAASQAAANVPADLPSIAAELPSTFFNFSSKFYELFAKASDFLSSFFPPGA